MEFFMRKIAQKNTQIIVTERAFNGFAYALNNTSVLTYLGNSVVDA